MGTKIWVAGLLAMATVGVPTFSALRLSQQQISAAQAEHEGWALIQRTLALMQMTRHHALNSASPAANQEAASRITAALLALRTDVAADARLAPAALNLVSAAQADWQGSVAAMSSGTTPAAGIQARQDRMGGRFVQIIDRLSDRSGLTVDSHPDTFYLMVASIYRLPVLGELVRQIRHKRESPAGLDVLVAMKLAAQQLEGVSKPLGKAATINPTLAASLKRPTADTLAGVSQLLKADDTEAAAGRTASAATLARYDQAADALFELGQLASQELDTRLLQRAFELRRTQYLQYGFLATLMMGLAALLRLIAIEFRQARLRLDDREHLLLHAEELAQIGYATTNLITEQITWSQGMYHLFGEPESEAVLHGNWLYHRVPQNERDFVRSISTGVTADAPSEFQHRILRADGKLRTVMHRDMVELDAQGFPRRQITILQDVTLQRDAEQRIDLLANTDDITGLPNRNALLDHLDVKVREAQREERNISLLVLEIDQLDIVTNTFGLEWGDRLLTQVADRLRLALEGRGMLAHLGNGEFAVVLTGTGGDVDEVRARDEAIGLREALSSTVTVSDTEVKVSCAQGLTLAPRDGDQPNKLLQQAQGALSQAKGMEADQRICVFNAEAHVRMASRLAMEASLRHALKRNEFELNYQPQVELQSGQIIGAEALLRWFDPKRNARISPVEFIPLAEETGQIVEIGEWVLRRACEQNMEWQRAGLRPIRISVNLSVRQLQQADIAQRIQTILLETGLDPQYLALEITESILVDESNHVASVLRTLGALGIEIALDDFGTGYSNLSYLRNLPIKVLKIDRSIVHDVTAASHDVSMTRAVINMAHGLQLKVLAEGVESEGQLALLMANHCDQMQGFFFSAAVTPLELSQMLRDGLRLPQHLYQHGKERERTILLVDDEENILSALKRLLRRDGYKIITATSGALGLQRLVEQPIDVIVSDQRMPGMTGVEFLRRAKELYPETVRIVLSGYTELQSITDAVNEGAIYKFLTKPWDDERLRGHIAEAFRTKEMADENTRLASAVSTANQELAAVNQRLEQLALRQSKKISQEETSLQIVREVLESIPASVIGIDMEGMVAYVNAEAEDLFAPMGGIFAMEAEQCLPAELIRIWQADDERPYRVDINGASYQVVCRVMNSSNATQKPRGKLLVLTAAIPFETKEKNREFLESHQ